MKTELLNISRVKICLVYIPNCYTFHFLTKIRSDYLQENLGKQIMELLKEKKNIDPQTVL